MNDKDMMLEATDITRTVAEHQRGLRRLVGRLLNRLNYIYYKTIQEEIVINNTILIARLTRDPELRYIPGSGTAVTKFNVAVNRDLSKEKKAEAESKGLPTADFINIVVWGKMAENCANYLAKGRLVGIQGRIQTGSYDKDGTKVYTTEVVASNVEFLEFGDKQQTNSGTNPGYLPEGFHPVDDSDFPF